MENLDLGGEVGYLCPQARGGVLTMRYEFKVVPAPRRGEKARGVKTSEERFALALTNAMNVMGAEGWDYVRCDTLPLDERAGLTGTKTSYQNMLVFRRALEPQTEQAEPTRLIAVDPGESAAPRLGGAGDVAEGAAPSLGPATDIAAE